MSVYLQITTRCNMKCAHCGFSCSARGQDMTEATLYKALEFAANRGEELLSIGGGEPTVHPRFWPFLGIIFSFDFENVWMATNGKRTMDALALANLANDRNFQVELSQDRYHEPVDDRVVRAFSTTIPSKGVGVRNTSQYGGLINAGRAKANQLGTRDECICPGLMIKPNGDIKPCGCVRAPVLGNVNTGGIMPEFMDLLSSDEFMNTECWTRYRKEVKGHG